MQVVAGEVRAVGGQRRVVVIAGGVLGGRVQRPGGLDPAMSGDEDGQQRKERECEGTHCGWVVGEEGGLCASNRTYIYTAAIPKSRHRNK